MNRHRQLATRFIGIWACILIAVTSVCYGEGATRKRVSFDFDWQFQRGDIPDVEPFEFDDKGWRTLDLPHDWSIEGNYHKDNPSGVAGGFLPTGTGWYRKQLNWKPSWAGQKILLTFDGVYMNSEVWVNGHRLGKRPNGYIGFTYDLTDFLKQGANNIMVRVDNSKSPSGRWYTGSGIYRHVWLTLVNPVHIVTDGIFVRSKNITAEAADVKITTEINNSLNSEKYLRLKTEIIDEQGRVVAQNEMPVAIAANKTQKLEQTLNVIKPNLWSPDSPKLYTVKSQIFSDDELQDIVKTKTGIRSMEFTVGRGFILNGETVILQGVSMHHDAGPVGSSVPEDVLRKRLRTLKEMGVNAIRTTHNPFAPEFYEMTDEMGFLVMNEAFDGWWTPKAKFDYGLYFDEWWQRDLTDFIRRDRNHPSVMMWSVGNEVRGYTPEQQKTLVEFALNLDDTRPVTQGRGYAGGFLTIAGFNGHGEYKGALQKFHKQNPDTPIIGTEMTHTMHTRGIFRSKTSYRVRDNPAPWETSSKVGPKKIWHNIKNKVYPVADLTEEEVFPNIDKTYGSSFDNSLVRMPIRDEIRLARSLPYLLGTFRWTAFDYIGEAFSWPARTSNFGVIDLAGFPKGVYYLYQSQWSKEPMVHMDPHWTHSGKEGIEIPVVVYTNQDSAELFLNGKSLGEKNIGDDMQLVWHVPYQAGELKVVAKKNGKATQEKVIRTAGQPSSVKITADRKTIKANRRDVVHLEVDIVDSNGNPVPWASDEVQFTIDGPARLIGVENGDILDLSPHKISKRKAFMGKLLGLIQATDKPGEICVTVSGTGLKEQIITIQAQ